MPEPQLTEEQVRKVARLSRLALSDEQVQLYRAQLSSILGYVERLRRVNLDGVEPLTHVSDAANRLDDDVPGPTIPTDTLMKMAPGALPPFIRVPKVLGEGGDA